MAFPVTFSPPGTVYVPSPEDALRTGVLMMFKADDLTRKTYAFDADNPAKGVRIYAGQEAATTGKKGERTLITPQLLITSNFGSTKWTYATANAGEKEITIIVSHIEALDTSYIDADPAAPEVTPETRVARFEKVLMYGTLVSDGQDSQAARVVDPYRSAVLENGTYDPAAIKYLNTLAPALARQFAVGQFAVAYSLIAVYTVDVSNRNNPTEAGTS